MHSNGKKASAHIVDAEARSQAERKAVDEELIRILKKRFEKSLPLNSINLVFIESEAARAYMASVGGIDGSMEMDGTHHEEE